MTQAVILAYLAIGIGLASYIPYFFSIAKGKTKPHAFSWFIWGLLTTIAFFAQMAGGAGTGAWVTGFTAALCYAIVVAALFKGEKQITKSDWATFLGALFTLPVWYMTKDPLAAIILITIIDALGFYPTFRKSWHKPHEEMPLAYGLSGLKFLIALFALENFTATTALYPFSLVVMNWIFVAMVLWRRKAVSIHV